MWNDFAPLDAKMGGQASTRQPLQRASKGAACDDKHQKPIQN